MPHGYPDWEGGKSRVYSAADWAAVEGIDINLRKIAPGIGSGGGSYIDHPVPAGKTLYISQMSFACIAQNEADRDNNQICMGEIYDFDDGVTRFSQGANGGGGLSFAKPIPIKALHTVWVRIWNFSNHPCNLYIAFGGYEV